VVETLAIAWETYGIGLALLAGFGGHLLIFVILIFVVVSRVRATAFRLACEVVYGLLNPLVYLIVLKPGLMTYEAGIWRQIPLQTVAWSLLGIVWGSRLIGSAFARRKSFNHAWRLIIESSLVCVVLFGVKDTLLYLHIPLPDGSQPNELLWQTWLFVGLAPLYLIPFVLLVDYLRNGFLDPSETDFLVLPTRPARVAGLVIGSVAVVSLGLALWRPSDAVVREQVLSHRNAIMSAASEYGVEPRAIAAIAYVTNRYQISPFRGRIERHVMDGWLTDSTSHSNLASALNISIGLTQIKPVTAQTTAQLVAFQGKTNPFNWAKEYRDVPVLEWQLPATVTTMPIPWGARAPKRDVVAALLTDDENIRACALILALEQLHWETSAGAARISMRPDILATLFQVGFERSHPKASPQSNAFGRQVQAAYDSAWIRDAFR